MQNTMETKMLIQLMFFIPTIIFVESCMEVEQCHKNMTSAVILFSKNLSQLFNETQTIEGKLNENVVEEVRKLNGEIANGPDACKSYELKGNPTLYVEAIFDCHDTVEIDEELVKAIDGFPSDYMETNTAEERVYYCEYLVPVLNYYCDRLRREIASVENCGLMEKFVKLYREPWEKCKNSNN